MTTKYISSNTSRNENQLIQPKTEVVENEIKNTNAKGNTGKSGILQCHLTLIHCQNPKN